VRRLLVVDIVARPAGMLGSAARQCAWCAATTKKARRLTIL